MRLSKVFLSEKSSWIIEENKEYYLAQGDPSSGNFQVTEKLEIDSQQSLEFAHLFWGKNVFGLGLNYKCILGEKDRYEEPLFFLKAANSICPNKSSIRYNENLEKVWVGVELVIILGKECKNITPDDADEYIFGYTIGSDITAQNLYKRDDHLARSKALDQFAPLGPWIETELDTDNLELTTYINGKLSQRGHTSNMVCNARQCVNLLSQYFTLFPGDLIFTGSPAGSMDSVVKPGDTVLHVIENLGELTFFIV